MACFTEPVSSMAEVYCNGAAVHAFPVDLYLSMLFAGSLSGADFHEEAILAHEVLGLCRSLCVVSFLLAIDQTTEVGHFA